MADSDSDDLLDDLLDDDTATPTPTPTPVSSAVVATPAAQPLAPPASQPFAGTSSLTTVGVPAQQAHPSVVSAGHSGPSTQVRVPSQPAPLAVSLAGSAPPSAAPLATTVATAPALAEAPPTREQLVAQHQARQRAHVARLLKDELSRHVCHASSSDILREAFSVARAALLKANFVTRANELTRIIQPYLRGARSDSTHGRAGLKKLRQLLSASEWKNILINARWKLRQMELLRMTKTGNEFLVLYQKVKRRGSITPAMAKGLLARRQLALARGILVDMKRRKEQAKIIAKLLHARRCQGPASGCTQPDCHSYRALYAHVRQCRVPLGRCSVRSCEVARRSLDHVQRCAVQPSQSDKCVTCRYIPAALRDSYYNEVRARYRMPPQQSARGSDVLSSAGVNAGRESASTLVTGASYGMSVSTVCPYPVDHLATLMGRAAADNSCALTDVHAANNKLVKYMGNVLEVHMRGAIEAVVSRHHRRPTPAPTPGTADVHGSAPGDSSEVMSVLAKRAKQVEERKASAAAAATLLGDDVAELMMRLDGSAELGLPDADGDTDMGLGTGEAEEGTVKSRLLMALSKQSLKRKRGEVAAAEAAAVPATPRLEIDERDLQAWLAEDWNAPRLAVLVDDD